MITSQDISFFLHLSASQSLAATARKLNVTPPSVSQRLQLLERKLGVKLVERSARSITLTASGEMLAEKGRALMLDLSTLQDDISANKSSLAGKVKVLAPLGFGTHYIAPLLARFKKVNPLITVDLELSDHPQWSDKQSPDIMIYIGHLRDSSLKCITLAKNNRLLLASPEYLKSAPAINCPADLVRHQCIALRENNEDVTMWKFQGKTDSENVSVRIKPEFSSNVGQVIKGWAVDGLGIIQRSEWDVVDEISEGKLIRLLPDYTLPSADIVALVSTERNKRPNKINNLIDFFKENLSL